MVSILCGIGSVIVVGIIIASAILEETKEDRLEIAYSIDFKDTQTGSYIDLYL